MLDNIIDLNLLTRFFNNLKLYIAEHLDDKQDTLISGTNIKTINNESVIGKGNINIGNKPLQETTDTNIQLSPNVYYRKTNQSSSITITLSDETSGILGEYFIEFTTASSGTTISLPNTIKWANAQTPTFDANSTYQISIVNNLGVCTKFA